MRLGCGWTSDDDNFTPISGSQKLYTGGTGDSGPKLAVVYLVPSDLLLRTARERLMVRNSTQSSSHSICAILENKSS